MVHDSCLGAVKVYLNLVQPAVDLSKTEHILENYHKLSLRIIVRKYLFHECIVCFFQGFPSSQNAHISLYYDSVLCSDNSPCCY